MTLDNFINIWWGKGIAHVFEAMYLDDVIDSIEADEGIPNEYIAFTFDPSKSQWKCRVYLAERWHKGTVEAFIMTDGAMCVFVDPYREDSE